MCRDPCWNCGEHRRSWEFPLSGLDRCFRFVLVFFTHLQGAVAHWPNRIYWCYLSGTIIQRRNSTIHSNGICLHDLFKSEWYSCAGQCMYLAKGLVIDLSTVTAHFTVSQVTCLYHSLCQQNQCCCVYKYGHIVTVSLGWLEVLVDWQAIVWFLMPSETRSGESTSFDLENTMSHVA